MRFLKLHMVWMLGLLFLVASCKEDEYYYPSVRLEFVTVNSGSDGYLHSLITDKGESLQVSEDLTNSSIASNSSKRVLSNYEVVPTTEGVATAKIYSLQNLLILTPKKANDPAYAGGIKTDPVDVISIWVGGDYLNLILNVKQKGGIQHVLGMVEESVEDVAGKRVITLSLFHNAKGDLEYYNRRAYISVPLTNYVVEGLSQTIRIKFKYHTYDKEGKVVESDKYCLPGFDYVPNKN